jgi:protein-disulfide isomerase
MRASKWLALAPLGLALIGGCSGDIGTMSVDSVVASKDGGAQSVPAGVLASVPAKTEFNPFAEPGAPPAGREVIENPTIADVMQPGALPEISMGRPDAPVTIIKYMSLTCPYCKRFHAQTFPVLKRDYIDKGHVRFILREFPIGFQSGHATIALRCAGPSRYFALYDKFLAQQQVWVSQEVRLDPIFKIASQVGMTRSQFDACFKDQAMIDGLRATKERGRHLGIIGTPNFFINGKRVKKVIDIDDIRAIVDPIIAGRVAARAG